MGRMGRSLEGKYVLVTGATSGMGKVTARQLAERGATVVLTGRDAEKTRGTVEEIQQRVPGSAVRSLLADLTSLAQVRTLAQAYCDTYPRLDVLIHNAGAMFSKRELNAEGLEKTFALNAFAPFLLTQLLLDTLQASAPARIVVVTSARHAGKQIPFDDMTH
jgi:retinol dehydrogenase 12